MYGNVWEWCEDEYDEKASGRRAASWRVCRGGSWLDPAKFCNSYVIGSSGASTRSGNLGFRVIRGVTPETHRRAANRCWRLAIEARESHRVTEAVHHFLCASSGYVDAGDLQLARDARLVSEYLAKRLIRTYLHDAAVLGAEMTRDATGCLTWDLDGVVRFWRRGALSWTITHPGQINAACMRADETQVITCGIDGTVRIWKLDADQPQLLRTFQHDSSVEAACFFDDRQILTWGPEIGVTLWNVSQNQAVWSFGSRLSGVWWKPGLSRILLLDSADSEQAWVCDAESRQVIQTVGSRWKPTGGILDSSATRMLLWSEVAEQARLWEVGVDEPASDI